MLFRSTYQRGIDELISKSISDNTADGTLDKFRSGLEAIKSNPERIKDENREDYINRINNILEQIDYAKSISKDLISTDNELKQTELLTKLNQKSVENRLTKINQELTTLKGKDFSILSELPIDVHAYKEAKLTLEGIQNIPNLSEQAKKLNYNINLVADKLVKAYPEQFKTIEDLNKSITSSNDEELKKLLTNKAVENKNLSDLKDLLHNIKNKPEEVKKDLNKKRKEKFQEATNITNPEKESKLENPFEGNIPEQTTSTTEQDETSISNEDRSEEQRLNSSHTDISRMPSSA